MKIRDLDNLTESKDGLYNLLDYTFVGTQRIALYGFVLEERHEMRPDLVSIEVYGDDSFVSTILAINNIQNPLSLKKGMVIIHTDVETAVQLNNFSEKIESLRDKLINKNKKKRTDQARNDFKSAESTREQAKNSRPSILSTKLDTVQLKDGIIKIEPGF